MARRAAIVAAVALFVLIAIGNRMSNESTASGQPSTAATTGTSSQAAAKPTATTVPAEPTATTKPEPTATPRPPRPTPTPKPQARARHLYRRDVDVRELTKNVDAYENWMLYYEGEVLSIFTDGGVTQLQVTVSWPGAGWFDYEAIIVITEEDTTGIFEDDMVAVWGRPQGRKSFTNAMGGRISQPLLIGDYVEKR